MSRAESHRRGCGWRSRCSRQRRSRRRCGRRSIRLAAGAAVLLAALALAGRRASPGSKSGTTSARDLTLVATLGGLAAAGRVLFAPVPDVQPVTVMVAAAGVALGPRRGFAVGAIAALASNFFLGQGVYTPWQMLAWGGCGVLGGACAPAAAAAPRVRRRSASFLGFAFGTTMDTWEWFTLLPAHVGGADDGARSGRRVQRRPRHGQSHPRAGGRARVAAGPRTPRASGTDGGRLGVSARSLAVLMLALVLATGARGSVRAGPLAGAGAFLAGAQQPDGGFAEAGGASDESLTAWGTLGLVASRGAADARSRALSYLRVHEEPGMSDTDVALRRARPARRGRPSRGAACPAARGLARAAPVTRRSGRSSRCGGRASRRRPSCVRDVVAAQSRHGGWSWLRGAKPDSNDTAAALEALRAAGVDGTPIVRGLAALRTFRNRDGGYALTRGRDSDAQSTAWAIQALFACGKRPGAATWRFSGKAAPAGRQLSLHAALRDDAGVGHRAGRAGARRTTVSVPGLMG